MAVELSMYQIPHLDSWQIKKIRPVECSVPAFFLSQLLHSKIKPVILGDLSLTSAHFCL